MSSGTHGMDELISDIFKQIELNGPLSPKELTQIIHKHNKGLGRSRHAYSKKKILPYYLKLKRDKPERLSHLTITDELERDFMKTVQIKPRRTASGVATITVITKPWPCSSACLYCPNDIRMPKSYLSDEPACQRAEHNFFDPYLQVTSRLRALEHMGHPTDKIELIVLGGTWSDYPSDYQWWFITELFRALNDGTRTGESEAAKRRQLYKDCGMLHEREDLISLFASMQAQVDVGECTYNEAIAQIAENNDYVKKVAAFQKGTQEQLLAEHVLNEMAAHRVVGLVIETRPDLIDEHSLTRMRTLGCTKIQMGIQSLDERVLSLNKRTITRKQIEQAFYWLRRFGFKIHVHYMLNLYGTDAASELEEYKTLVHDGRYMPDEVKLYPCVLVEGSELNVCMKAGTWKPYSDDELLKLLVDAVLETPEHTRISRMIRDISSHDIIAGNKRTNLRQLVEQQFDERKQDVREIRYREVNVEEIDVSELRLEVSQYATVGSDEYFLQWVTPSRKIAGFLRLSLPTEAGDKTAMIREVHIYGKVAHLQKIGDGPQHLGLGRMLIEEACHIAQQKGYQAINVISAVGTRVYYRKQGFADNGLYQQKSL